MKQVRWMVVLALMAPGIGQAQDAWFVPTDPHQAELEEDHNVHSQFVTPHTRWGSPWARGSAKVLFFVNGRGTAAREVIELKQRFDFEAQMVFWGRIVDTPRDDWHGADLGQRRINRLLGEPWDAFVFLGVKIEWLTPEQQHQLLTAVADGAGLVLSGFDDPRVMKATNRIDPPPPSIADGAVGDAHQLRQGRGLSLPGQPAIAYAPGWEVAYDHWAQQLGRGILWAAGKEPRVRLVLTQPAAEVARESLPGHEMRIAWEAPAEVGELAIEATLRRADGWATPLPALTADGRVGAVTVPLPRLRAELHHLDVIARSPAGIEAFGTLGCRVTSARRVERVELDQDWAEVQSELSGRVRLAGDGVGPAERLTVSLLDRRGRELQRRVSAPTAETVAFRFTVEPWLPMLVTVRATLADGADEVASAWAYARVTKRHRGQFNFLIWDVPRGTLAPYAEESLARHGMTLQLGQGTPPEYVAAHDVAWVPYTTHIEAKKDAAGTMDPMCWNDEARVQAHVDEIAQKHLGARRHGVFAYSLGDEIAVRGSCLSPPCLAAYQRYLAEVYPDIAALNASWGSDYQSFSEVQLSRPDDDAEAEALRVGNFPRWFDRQAYQSHNFGRLCERFGAAFRAIDPEAIWGFEGAGTFRDGDDLDGFVRANTFWAPYPGIADEVLRSIAPRNFPRANWMGYSKDADALLQQYWRMVTRGSDAVWWWRWEVIGRFRGWLSPTLDPYPAVAELLCDTQVVRDGLGDLLLQAEMLDDGVGILFSHPSAYASRVQHSPGYGSYQGEHVAWQDAIRELGLNFRYVTDRQLRLGEARLDGLRLLILPQAQALGPREAEALRAFVRDGGVLLADVRPGIYDGHVKPLERGVLDDLFGVERTSFAAAASADCAIEGTLAGRPVALAVPGARVDPGIAAAGAEALGRAGETPVYLVHRYGRGQAVLLNYSLSSHPSLAVEATPEAAADLLLATLALAGVEPAVRLEDDAGQRLRNVEVTRWRSGDTDLLAVFRKRGQAQSASLILAGNRQVYDLKKREALGRQDRYGLTVTPCRALFLATTAAAAQPAAVTVGQPTVARGAVLRATVSFPGANGVRAARLQVTLPDGGLADWLDQNVVAGANGVVLDLPMAYNDPPGVWTLQATELYTGQTTTCQVTVE